MNQLNNFLKKGFASRALSSSRMVPVSEALARGMILKSEGLVRDILSTPFFTGPSKLSQKQLTNILAHRNSFNSTQLTKVERTDVSLYSPIPLKQNSNSGKQLSQQVQYNVISTKEFHEQKKHYTKVKAFLKEFALLLKEGTKDTYVDGKWYFNLLRKKKREEMTGYELRESLLIRSDLLKIIPFSFFVIVPMAELLLPFYLLLFPNAMPSQYTFDYAYDQKIQQLEDNQAASHEVLVHMLKTHLIEKCNVSVDHFLHSDTYKQVFFKYYKSFDEPNGLDFQKMSSEDLLQVCHFLGMEVITGTAIISKILQAIINTPIFFTNLGRSVFKQEKFSYSNFELKFNFGPFEILKRNLILLQIKRHLSLLRQQDQAFFKMGFHDIIGHRITNFARERGITTITCYETLKAILSNEWVNVCRDNNFNDNAMFWYAIMQYDFLRNANNDMN